MMLLKWVALVVSLGMDTLLLSVSLGMAKPPRVIRLALTFATAEAVMPLLGLGFGVELGHWIGRWTGLVGGLALVALAAWMVFWEDDDGESAIEERLRGWLLVVTALSVSLDELAVGFSFGVTGISVWPTVIWMAVQSFLFTWLGIRFGGAIRPYLGEWAEKAAGLFLGILGLWIVIEGLSTFGA